MPLPQPLPDLRRTLQEQLTLDMPAAFNALKALLPDTSEKYSLVATFQARLNDANKERYRNTISTEEYQRRCDQVRADFFDLIAALEEADFDPQSPQAKSDDKPSVKTGSVLYRIPDIMPLSKSTRCTIRIAIDEDAILENIILDDQVHVKSQIEVSDVMSAELVDPEGGTFQITALNARTQLVRDTGYTEWLFGVTPLKEGVHQLLVKVSIMEVVPGFAEPVPREVSVEETITILTEAAVPKEVGEAPLKTAGLALSFGGDNQAKAGAGISRGPTPLSIPSPVMAQSMRKLIAFAAVAVVAVVAALLIIPKIKNTPPSPFPGEENPKTEQVPSDTPSATLNPKRDSGDNANPSNPGKDHTTQLPVNPNPAPSKPLGADPAGVQPGDKQRPREKNNSATLPVNPNAIKTQPPSIVTQLPRRSGFTMIRVPGGAFTVGQSFPDYDGIGNSRDECPHAATVRSFEIGQYEVTCADWREVMGENAPASCSCDECPVGGVSWYDVKAFIQKANEQRKTNYRLPTEKEWEYAAKGGQSGRGYKFAGDENQDEVAWCVNNSKGRAHPVGTRKPNELQLCDMSGNVYEWCEDTYQAYADSCKGQYDSTRRVLRGGSWNDEPHRSRVANRANGDPSRRVKDFGFRLARD